MRIILLGSAVATGLPGWNDGRELALRARRDSDDLSRRSGMALALSADNERFSILEAPPSLADQISSCPALQPTAGSRAAPIDTMILSEAGLDTTLGLLPMRAGFSARIISPNKVREALLTSPSPFLTLQATWSGYPIDRPFLLDRQEALEARFFPLPGPDPDFLRESAPRIGRSRVGIRIVDRASGLRIVWAPRISRFDSATLAELRAADIRFVDGRFYSDDEVRSVQPGVHHASDLGHVAVAGQGGSQSWLSGMSGRSIYVGLGETNPLLDPASTEATSVAASGLEIGFDGMAIGE